MDDARVVVRAENHRGSFETEFQCGLPLSECLRVDTRNYDFHYGLQWESGEGGVTTFPFDRSLEDALGELKIDPTSIKAAQISGNLLKQIGGSHAGLVRALLEDLVAHLPNLIRLRIVVPRRGNNIGRFNSIMRPIWKEAASSTLELGWQQPRQPHVTDQFVNLKGGGKFEIKFHLVDNNYDDSHQLGSAMLLDSLVQEMIRLLQPTLQKIKIVLAHSQVDTNLRADTFQMVGTETPNLQYLELNGSACSHTMDFVFTMLVNSLNTSDLSNSSSNNNNSGRKKRKRRRRGLQTLGTLNQLVVLHISSLPLHKNMLKFLLRGLESNTTLKRFCLTNAIINPTDEIEDWEDIHTPILSLLRNNTTLIHLRVMVNLRHKEDRSITRFKRGLKEILRNNNHSIAKIDLGITILELHGMTNPMTMLYQNHNRKVTDLMNLNLYKLRPYYYLGEESGSITKQQFLQGLVSAMEISEKLSNNDDDQNGGNQRYHILPAMDQDSTKKNLVSGLFLVFQSNPWFVAFLEEEMCS